MKIWYLIIIFIVVVGDSSGQGFAPGQAYARGFVAVVVVYLLVISFKGINRLLKKINDDANN